jgi:hypothetical protein
MAGDLLNFHSPVACALANVSLEGAGAGLVVRLTKRAFEGAIEECDVCGCRGRRDDVAVDFFVRKGEG